MSARVRMSDEPPSAADGRPDWHDELTGEVFGLMIGISRLMAHVQAAPPERRHTIRSSPRRRGPRAKGTGFPLSRK